MNADQWYAEWWLAEKRGLATRLQEAGIESCAQVLAEQTQVIERLALLVQGEDKHARVALAMRGGVAHDLD